MDRTHNFLRNCIKSNHFFSEGNFSKFHFGFVSKSNYKSKFLNVQASTELENIGTYLIYLGCIFLVGNANTRPEREREREKERDSIPSDRNPQERTWAHRHRCEGLRNCADRSHFGRPDTFGIEAARCDRNLRPSFATGEKVLVGAPSDRWERPSDTKRERGNRLVNELLFEMPLL